MNDKKKTYSSFGPIVCAHRRHFGGGETGRDGGGPKYEIKAYVSIKNHEEKKKHLVRAQTTLDASFGPSFWHTRTALGAVIGHGVGK
jgi:hypothetical protein